MCIVWRIPTYVYSHITYPTIRIFFTPKSSLLLILVSHLLIPKNYLFYGPIVLPFLVGNINRLEIVCTNKILAN